MGVRLTWVALALSKDVPAGVAVPSKVMDQELVVWRSASGQVRVWDDRCPHRGMRLSHGFVRGESLNCIYHGWQYGQDGGCTSIPAHPDLNPPKTICAQVHSVLERDGVVWTSMTATDVPPPDLEHYTPVRTLPIAVSANVVETFWGGPSGLHIVGPHAVVLQPTSDHTCNLHGFTQHDLKAASRWMESERKTIEASR